MTELRLPVVGDILQSPQFVIAQWDCGCMFGEQEALFVGSNTDTESYEWCGFEHKSISSNRAFAKWVVEEAGYRHKRHWAGERYQISLRRLRYDGSYDPNGEMLWAYLDPEKPEHHENPLTEYTIVGRMELSQKK